MTISQPSAFCISSLEADAHVWGPAVPQQSRCQTGDALHEPKRCLLLSADVC